MKSKKNALTPISSALFRLVKAIGFDSARSGGFTLIELLVVISIIGLLASVVLVSLNSSRVKARDARRLADMAQIQKALALYYDQNNRYPDSDGQGCGGWDTPGDGDFIDALKTAGITKAALKDPNNNYDCGNYRYYRYPPQGDCLKSFFVLGVVDMEGSNNPHPQSPGWKCTGAGARDWQGEMEWVAGGFE